MESRDTIKRTIYALQECQTKEEEGEGTERIFKAIMAEDFPNLGTEMDIQSYEAQRITNGFNPERATQRYIIMTLSKAKDRKQQKSKTADSHPQ